MKIRILLLTLFCSICFSASAQVDAFQENIVTYLNSNGTVEEYGEVYDGVLQTIKKQFLEVPENEWNNLKVGKEESVQDALKFLAFAYRKHFTESDIAKMSNFYKTESAQKLVSGSNNLTNEDNENIDAFFQSDVGLKITSKAEELSVDTSKISDTWSRELFAEKMSALIKKGYSTKY